MFDEVESEDPDLNPFSFAILKGSTDVFAVAKVEYFEVKSASSEIGIGKYASIAYLCGKGSGSGTKLTKTLIDLHRKKGFVVRVASLDSAKGYWRGWGMRRKYAPREVTSPSLYVEGRNDSKFYWGEPVDLSASAFLPRR